MQGDLARGELLLDEFLLAEPQNPAALDFKAQLVRTRGDLDAAASIAQSAVKLAPLAPYALTLADILLQQRKTDEAKFYYEKVLARMPQEPRCFAGLGEIAELRGNIDLAIHYFEKALESTPSHAGLAIRWSRLLPIKDLPRGLEALKKAKPDNSRPLEERLDFFSHYVTYKEWAERVSHGKMPYHAESLAGPHFKYAAEDFAEYEKIADDLLLQTPDSVLARSAKASALFCRGQTAEAETLFHSLARTDQASIYDDIVFNPGFFDVLRSREDREITTQFPAIATIEQPTLKMGPIIYLACNYEYYVNFTRTFLLSIDAIAQGSQIHLHVIDPVDTQIESVKSFCAGLKNISVAITTEQSGIDRRNAFALRCYYHAVRFIRLYQHLKIYRKPLWLMDVDALLNRAPSAMFTAAQDCDVAFRARPGRWEPWNQFNASVVGFSPTARGLEFCRLIATYIAHFYERNQLRWGIDQLAMYSVYEYLKRLGSAPLVKLLNDREVDNHFNDDGFVWCNSGRGKFLQMQKIQKGLTVDGDSQMQKYVAVLQQYWSRLS